MKIAIPARYASSRFPGKPLALIAGKPMIERVWARAVLAAGDADDVYVATDDDRIAKAVDGFGGQYVMTRPDHENGTERLAELVDRLALDDAEIVVNVQGDEPVISPDIIRLVGEALREHPEAALSTAAEKFTNPADAESPDMVKTVLDKFGYAHYFSRATIPHIRDGMDGESPFLRHIGIYAYRARTLRTLKDAEPAPTEELEKLEQLRALWHGMKIHVSLYDGPPSIGVDTPTDIGRVEAFLAEQSI